MYNIRRKLCILAAIFFIAAALVMHFTGQNNASTVVAQSAQTASINDGQAAASAANSQLSALFGQNTEKFVAHRGYSGFAPENSIPAFELAGRIGFWGIETDISETSDGHFICMHDDEIDRTTNGSGKVGQYTLQQLSAYKIDEGNNLKTTENLKIPTLEEYLSICKKYGCVGIVEIKTINNYDAFLSAISQSGMSDKCIITGGNIEDVNNIRQRNSSVPVMVIGYTPDTYTKTLDLITALSGSHGVLYNYPQVGQNEINELHSKNIFCGVWSVDDADTARKYLDYGADFIITNDIPARLDFMVNENE